MVLLHPAYLPNIATLAVIAQHEILWDVSGNYQKQTYRNRTYITTDHGKLLLGIPVVHRGNSARQSYADIRIDYTQPWMRTHWRSLETAYRTSPFFEFYEHFFAELYLKEELFLVDFNLRSIEALLKCLQLPFSSDSVKIYDKTPVQEDLRILIDAKKKLDYYNTPYHQVFNERNGFIENISAIDLICNEGPNALSYLKSETLPF